MGKEEVSLRITLPPELHKRLRYAALDEDTTLTELVVCVLDTYTALPANERNVVKQHRQTEAPKKTRKKTPKASKVSPAGEDLPMIEYLGRNAQNSGESEGI